MTPIYFLSKATVRAPCACCLSLRCAKNSKSIHCKESNQEIDYICKDFSKVLTLWNGVLSIVHKEEPSEDDFDETLISALLLSLRRPVPWVSR